MNSYFIENPAIISMYSVYLMVQELVPVKYENKKVNAKRNYKIFHPGSCSPNNAEFGSLKLFGREQPKKFTKT